MFKAFHVPINPVSFGQVSTALLKEVYRRTNGGEVNIFPIGNVDLSAQKNDEGFVSWLNENIKNSQVRHNREDEIFKLWHIVGSLESYSAAQHLYTFYELDEPTPLEINILKNQKTVIVSTDYTKDVLESSGLKNVWKIPLFFDEESFYKTEKSYLSDRITFNICGKFENRKHHVKSIRSWINKYGNNKDYFLQCAIHNPFLSDEDNKKVVEFITEGKKFWNVTFLPRMKENRLYNDFLNSADVIIGASSAEGWGLPEFQSVCLGKHAVLMNAHAYKEWADEDSVCFFEAGPKEPAYDNMFFKKGQEYNQGNIFGFDQGGFIDACERAIGRVRSNRENVGGYAVKEKYTVSKFYDNLSNLQKEVSEPF